MTTPFVLQELQRHSASTLREKTVFVVESVDDPSGPEMQLLMALRVPLNRIVVAHSYFWQ